MKNTLLLLLLLSLVACTQSKQKVTVNTTFTHNGKSKLSKTDLSKKFPLESQAPAYSFAMFLFEDNNINYLSYYGGKNRLYVYRIDTEELVFSKEFSYDGPDGLGNINSIYPISLDQFFIFTFPERAITVINQNGEILNKWEYETTIQNTDLDFFSASSNMIKYPFVEEDKILFPRTYYDWVGLKPKDIIGKTIIIEKDIKNLQVKELPINYPEFPEFPENTSLAGMLLFSALKSSDLYVFSFIGSSKIYWSDGLTPLESKEAKSLYEKKLYELAPPSENTLNRNIWGLSKTWYDNLVYDKYREVYYRFVYPGVEVSTKDNLDQMLMYKKIFSVQIIDKNFDVIGETLFPEDTYFMKMFFITQEGLFISTNHINNPNLNEDILEFQCFELTKNEE